MTDFQIPPGTTFSEDTAALQFEATYKGRLAYCHDQGRWFEFDGSIWRIQRTPIAFHYARELCRHLSNYAPSPAALQKMSFATAVERASQAVPAMSRTSDHWNPDPLLLGTPDGTVDLRTGRLRPSIPSDNISSATTVTPAQWAECPLWLEFLRVSTGDDGGLTRFLQQIAGYCLTGLTTEHALFFIYGPGGNGKSVFLNVLTKILGDYSRTAAMTTLEKARAGAIASDLATLAPARMVTASETEEGLEWAQARVQSLTGGDPITARFMRQNEFTYIPKFKLLIVGNHKPAIRSVDDAIKRRVNIIPFTVKPKNPDKELEEKLVAEWPAILRWMIDGCLDWQEHGLVRPRVVLEATDEYFNEQNILGQWLEECCDVDFENPFLSASATSLFRSWLKFLASRGEDKQTMKSFVAMLVKAGFPKKTTKLGKFYENIRLQRSDEEPF